MTEKKVESVYAMLGYPDPESMQLKARLADKIDEIMKARGLTQTDAAKVIGMPQPKLSNLLNGQFRGVSEAKMMECITRLGSSVDIVIRDASAGERAQVKVVPAYRTTTRRRRPADKTKQPAKLAARA